MKQTNKILANNCLYVLLTSVRRVFNVQLCDKWLMDQGQDSPSHDNSIPESVKMGYFVTYRMSIV